MSDFVILVTGSREWRWERYLRSALENEARAASSRPVVIRHGAARGVDTIADNVAGYHGWKRDPHPVRSQTWRALGKRAGRVRNEHMVNLGADICVAFWRDHSRGTGNCIELARAAGIPVKIYHDCSCHTVGGEER